jgi:hypothetical protein
MILIPINLVTPKVAFTQKIGLKVEGEKGKSLRDFLNEIKS